MAQNVKTSCLSSPPASTAELLENSVLPFTWMFEAIAATAPASACANGAAK